MNWIACGALLGLMFCLDGLVNAEEGNGTSRGAAEGSVVAPEAVAVQVGHEVTVQGMVTEVHQTRKGHLFINFGGVYPDMVFSAYIPASAHLGHAELKTLLGKVVKVTGKVRLYQGKPEIIVTRREQIWPPEAP